MASYLLPRDKLNLFLTSLDDFQVWAPVSREGSVSFEPISGTRDILLDLQHQPLTAKRAIFPQTESLFTFDRTAVPHAADLTSIKETLIFGIRPCDARSFSLLDPVFEDTVPDPYYLTRRHRAVLAGIACTAPFANCFCTSIGGDPFSTAGLDLLFIEGEDSFRINVITERGQKILDTTASLLTAAQEKDTTQNEERAQKARAMITRHLDIASVPEKLSSLFEHSLWKQCADKCLGCGICTYACPTCYCFDMQDETGMKQGRRVRIWDSCMFAEYTLHASGHNPRPTRRERLRNRMYHKFKFNMDSYGIPGCVGCGRCITLCPVNVDLIENLLAIQEAE